MMQSERKLYEFFYHFMEQISFELVRMGLYWRCEDFETDTENDPLWPDLKWRLDYTEYFMKNCRITEEGIFPCDSIPIPTDIINKYSLVYDSGPAKGLIKRAHPDEPFVTKDAFDGKFYRGWEVKFFETEEEAKGFAESAEFESFSLYKGFNKIF